MYTPKHFRVEDPGACHDLIEQNPFGLLVGPGKDGDGAPSASHVPFHLDRTIGEFGELQVHLARANPQAKAIGGQRVRCIFSGPHAYVSPTWFDAGPAVPTWNYLAVHCVGFAEPVTDQEELASQMERLSAHYEGGGGWRFDALPDKYRAGMLKSISGFRIRIEQLFGKAKLSQNKSDSVLEGTIRGLRATGRSEDEAVADLMEAAKNS